MFTKSVYLPSRSKELAEFVGIMLGDGGITPYQVTITIDSENDREYIHYIVWLAESLFRVPASASPRRSCRATDIKISRTALVRFCNIFLGLPIGNKLKQGLNIPSWIMENAEYQKACIRGLIDTDGCIFFEQHVINGKVYRYPRLNLRSASPALLLSVQKIFHNFGLSGIMRSDRSLQLESKKDIAAYFEQVGTSNPKHRRRYNDH
jgi:hypothetical protein